MAFCNTLSIKRLQRRYLLASNVNIFYAATYVFQQCNNNKNNYKMNTSKRAKLSLSLLLLVLNVLAQGPNNSGTYYQDADGKKGSALKTAMAGIINKHTQLSYNGLWEAFKTTDKRSDGKVWDMYSGTTNFTFGTDQAGNYKKEGDVYNREHSLPKSWFDDAKPMYTDLMHLVPTDGYVNGRRSNYPFGETNNPTYSSNGGFSKLGSSSVSGYSGTVFEPNDEYKGDFARIYFYMVTCYESNVSTWKSDMLAGNKYPAFSQWALDMLLRWAAEDPVSPKEVNRNNAVYKLQGNRNPFVDYPGLEQYVWGSKTGKAFSYDNYDTSAIIDVQVKDIDETDVYTITGVKVRSNVDNGHATDGLKAGVYVINGKKVLVK